MAWQTPKTNWQAADVVSKDDFNRIEGNIQELQDTKETSAGAQAKVDIHANSKQTHGISSGYYIAKTSRSDQFPAWSDIQGKPKIINGEIYSTLFQTGEEGASDYLKLSSGLEPLLVVNGNKEALSIWATGVGGSIQFFNPSVDDMRGQILPYDDADGVGLRVHARNNGGSMMDLNLVGSNIEMRGNVWVNNNLRVFGDKDAVVPTENYGLRALSVIEMPETKFMDEGIGEIVNGVCRIDIDPIFLETIEPNTPETPFIVHLTPYDWLDLRVKEIGDTYFIVEEKEGLSGKFSWQLTATRKGYAGRRLDRVDDEDVLTSNWEDDLNEFLEQED